MLIPLYVLVGVWGGPGRLARDAQVRHLHDRRLAADAGGDRRLRRLAGHVRPRRGRARATATGSSSASSSPSRSRRRSSRSTAGCRTPTASRRRRSRPCSRASSRRRPSTASCGSRSRSSRSRSRTSDARSSCSPRSGSSTARCVAFRAPDLRGVIAYSSLAQMGLITMGLFAGNEPGWNGADPAVGRARARLGDAVPARRRGRAAHGRRGELALLGGMAKGRPGARDAADDDRDHRARRARARSTFAGEFLILAGVFDAGWGWAVDRRGRDRARGDVHAARDLGGAARGAAARASPTRRSTCARPSSAILVPLVALPARALGLAGGGHASARSRATPARRMAPSRRRPSDRHAGRRLVRALARRSSLLGAVGRRAARRRARPARGCAGSSPRSSPRPASSPRSSSPRCLFAERRARRPSSSATRSRATATPALATLIVCGAGLLAVGVSWAERSTAEHRGEYYALLAATAAGMVFFVGART